MCERFDKALENDCGHCGFCETRKVVVCDEVVQKNVPPEVLEAAIALQKSMPSVLATPADLTKVLRGLSSPAIAKAKLARHELFACCAEISFANVRAAIESSS